ncbi:hypothetical protein [Paenibacillus anseongense]|uniref:hypothetical protein n=1 Tax=Paenibacillus anseongense TaxID=2682845 RepID=UPI002DBF6D34|nr:hypothetical protein [Paenibacillus anseongense]
MKLIFEIKGYASQVRDMDRQKYCNELNRETFLHAMDFHVISFAYDDIEQRPDLCITLLRMMLSKYQPSHPPVSRAQLAEKEVIRLAIEQSRSLRPSYGGSRERIVRYELAREAIDYF